MKALPYVAVVVLAVVIAAFVFWSPSGSEAGGPSTATAGSASGRTVRDVGGDNAGDNGGDNAGEEGAPGEGGVRVGQKDPNRPVTPAEEALKARRARPFNAHYERVASYWGQGAKYALGEGKSDLAKEMSDMDAYLQAQSRLNDGETDFPAAYQAELDLIAKVRTAGLANPEVPGMMAYVEAVTLAAQAGRDPAQVTRPTLEQLQAGTYTP